MKRFNVYEKCYIKYGMEYCFCPFCRKRYEENVRADLIQLNDDTDVIMRCSDYPQHDVRGRITVQFNGLH